MTIEEAKKLALQILKNVMEMKITKYNVEVAALKVDTGKFEIYSHDHV
jgi:20S proteasome alpha/beta subunit